MLLVDSFRVFVLVGLICASGITPSQAAGEICKAADVLADCEESTTGLNCKLTIADGKGAGCALDVDCTGVTDDGKITCEDGRDYCCCKASSAVVCNDLTVKGVMEQACALDPLKGMDYCKPKKPETPGGPPPEPSGVKSPPQGDLIADSATSLTISTGVILSMMSLGAFWSHDGFRL